MNITYVADNNIANIFNIKRLKYNKNIIFMSQNKYIDFAVMNKYNTHTFGMDMINNSLRRLV